jgi:hypothetical protein
MGKGGEFSVTRKLRQRRVVSRARIRGLAGILSCFWSMTSSSAQDGSGIPAYIQDATGYQDLMTESGEISTSAATRRSIGVRPELRYQFVYGDGVLRRPGETRTIALHTLTPGVTFEKAGTFSLYYFPTLQYYSKGDFEDRVTHTAGMRMTFRTGAWTGRVGQSFHHTASPLVETGGEIQRTRYGTSIGASRLITEAISIQLGGSQDFTFTDQINSWRRWSTMNWVQWQARPRIGVGVGLGGGYDQVEFGTDMTHQTVMGRGTWRPGDRLRIGLDGGFEARQFLDLDAGSRVRPVYGLSAEYGMFEKTVVSVSARRSVSPSILRGRVTEATVLSAGVRQGITPRIALSLDASYRMTEFRATDQNDVALVREDRYWTVRPAAHYRLMNRASLSVFFQHMRNESGVPGYSFEGQMIGAQFRYGF